MEPVDQRGRFEREVLPHLDAAYNLARWLLRNDQDAEDVTQEGLLRAYRHFAGFRGVNAKAWLLTIVRNACYGWIGQRNAGPQAVDAAELERLSAVDRLASPATPIRSGRLPSSMTSSWCAVASASCRSNIGMCWCCAKSKVFPTRRSARLPRSPSGR
jgi:DNA-directed RNA polymerase specialized sigma24 family protein